MISFFATSHFSKLIARFSSFSLCKILSKSFSCSSRVSYVIISMSSRYANLILYQVMFIYLFLKCCWHICKSVESFTNLYVSVAFPPRILKLQCFLMFSSGGIWLYAYLRSIFENQYWPGIFFFSDIYTATESMR